MASTPQNVTISTGSEEAPLWTQELVVPERGIPLDALPEAVSEVGEIAYAERTTDVTVNTNAWTTITGLSVLLTGTGRPVAIEAFLPSIYFAGTTPAMFARLLVNGATPIGELVTATYRDTIILKRRLVLQRGAAVQVDVQARTELGGDQIAIIASGVTATPAYLSVASA